MNDLVTYQVGDLTDFRPDDPYYAEENDARKRVVELSDAEDVQRAHGIWRHEDGWLPDCIAIYYEGNWYRKS